MSRTILFAGGGSGGHLFPGIAVARKLFARDGRAEAVFVGTDRATEREILTREGFAHHALPVRVWAGMRRSLNWGGSQLTSIVAARRILRERRAFAVVGLGGYASVPTVLAAKSLGIPVLLLEQNVLPGKANRKLAKMADRVCVAYSESAAYFPSSVPVIVTGNPVRREIAGMIVGDGSDGQVGEDIVERRTILVLGGSQGARTLNAHVPRAIGLAGVAAAGWNVIHQTGASDGGASTLDDVSAAYAASGISARVEPFLTDMPDAYRRAGLVVSRAGATTLAELACAGLPTILTPFPQAADDHQTRNAALFAASGAARVCAESDPTEDFTVRLGRQIGELAEDAGRRRRMSEAMQRHARPDAAANVADELLRWI